MFNFEEYEKIMFSSPEDAREYCKKFPNDLLAQSELLTLDIIYFRERSYEQNYQELKYYYKVFKNRRNKMALARVASNLTFYGFDLNDIINVKKYALTTLKYLPDYLEIQVILANINIRMRIDEEACFEFSKKNCNNDNLNIEIRNICFASIGEYYYQKGLFEEGRSYFEKCFLWSNDKIILRREILNMSLGSLANLDILREDYENYISFIDEEEKYSLTQSIIDKLIERQYIDEASKYVDVLKKISNDEEKNKLNLLYDIRIKGFKGKYDEVLEIFDNFPQEELNNNPYALYLLGTTIFLKEDRRLYDKGVEAFKNAYKLLSNDSNLANLLNAYFSNFDYENFDKYLELFNNKKGAAFNYLSALSHIKKGNWDAAEKLLLSYMRKCKARTSTYLYVMKKPNAISQAIYQDYLNGTTIDDYRSQAAMYLHGYGITNFVNPKKAKDILESKINDSKFNNCCLSTLGNSYLALKENELAFKTFKSGHERYMNHLDICSCCSGFYCYCLALGIGTKQNQEEALSILESIGEKYLTDIGKYTYAYLCLELNINLNKAWNMLNNHNEIRYDTGKYFMLIKLAERLGKDVKALNQYYKKCLKYVPLAEKLHYLDNPNIFYLTNN